MKSSTFRLTSLIMAHIEGLLCDERQARSQKMQPSGRILRMWSIPTFRGNETYFGAGITPPYPLLAFSGSPFRRMTIFNYTDKAVRHIAFTVQQRRIAWIARKGAAFTTTSTYRWAFYFCRKESMGGGRPYELGVCLGEDALFDVPRDVAKAGFTFHLRWKETDLGEGSFVCRSRVPSRSQMASQGRLRKGINRMESCYFAIANVRQLDGEPFAVHFS